MLSLGLLGALWASSSGVTAIMEALNVVYGATETRPYWKVRVLASPDRRPGRVHHPCRSR